MADAKQRGRPPLDKVRRERDQRRAVLHKGMLACYEIIDMARKELAELDSADGSGMPPAPAVELVDCAMCHGVGRHGTPGARCSWCDGTGKVKRLAAGVKEDGNGS